MFACTHGAAVVMYFRLHGGVFESVHGDKQGL
jgi:hypothetical protein